MSIDGPSRQSSPSIDLVSVRDTLRYIEGDLRGTPQHAQLRAILGLALAEIGRIEGARDADGAHHRGAALFIPARG
jgi:hypothetical protein